MSFPKVILLSSLCLFVVIGSAAMMKKIFRHKDHIEESHIELTMEPVLETNEESPLVVETTIVKAEQPIQKVDAFPQIDRIEELFTLSGNALPIVETISYTSRVPWLKGRPAWIADYSSYYNTSRHFIARSLNKKRDYFTQNVSFGSRFNVFRKDKDINFYLLVDLSLRKMAFYYIDLASNERVLLKTYDVGLGRLDPNQASGSQTPLGKYLLGNKIGIYKKGDLGYYLDQKLEMIQIFGTRWIPFEKEVGNCTAPAKGFGIHGAPWKKDHDGQISEQRSSIGNYESDGCIRLLSEDMEELFSIIITKPTYVEIVKDVKFAELPGREVTTSTY